MISEEHEFSTMPAQLTITPVIDYKIARQHEILVEIYYNDSNDEENLNQLVEELRSVVKVVGGNQAIDSQLLFSHEEKIKQESFLFMKGQKLSAKLKSCGFSVDSATAYDVLEGAEIFAQSAFFDESVMFSKSSK